MVMRPLVTVLRLAPLAVAALFSVATSMPAPLEAVTCDPVGEPFTPAAIELGAAQSSESPDGFIAWHDGDGVYIQSDGNTGDAQLVYRLRVVGDGLPECVRQIVVVSDAQGFELGRLDAALLTQADGPAAQLSYEAPVDLNRWPATGEALTIEATVGETTIAVFVNAL
jgi:hypothetical protein